MPALGYNFNNLSATQSAADPSLQPTFTTPVFGGTAPAAPTAPPPSDPFVQPAAGPAAPNAPQMGTPGPKSKLQLMWEQYQVWIILALIIIAAIFVYLKFIK